MTNRSSFVLVAAIVTFSFSVYADQKYTLNNSSEVTFVAKITAGSFVVKSKDVHGYVVLDDTGKKLVSAEIIVPATSLDSGMSVRDEHMQNKYLEAGKFPNITFSFKDAKTDFQADAANPVTGDFIIKDAKKSATVSAMIKHPDKKLQVTSDFPLLITDYGIEQPKFAVVKMDTTVNVHVDLSLEQKP